MLVVTLGSIQAGLRAQTWTSATTEFPTTTFATKPSIAFGNGVFVAAAMKAVAAGNVSVHTSTDGTEWTERTFAVPGLNLVGVGKVFFANGRFAIMGDGSDFSTKFGWSATSPDGTTWTVATNTGGINASQMAGGNGTYIITAGTGMRISTDHGATWGQVTMPSGGTANAGWGDVAYLDGRFIMTGEGFSPKWWTSADGVTWTETTIAGTGGARVESGNGVVIRYVGSYRTSTDMLSFTEHSPAPLDNGVNRNLVFSGSRFLFDKLVFAGITPTVTLVTSTDGLAFTDFGTVPLSSFNLTSAVEGNGRIVIVGTNGVSRAYAFQTEAPSAPTAPAITTAPQSQSAAFGGTLTLNAAASGGAVSYQWTRNGADLSGETNAALTLLALQPSTTGLYSAVATNGAGSATSDHAIIGLTLTTKVLGTASEFASDIVHQNGNVFDQILLEGAAASFTADSSQNQITRLSFIDMSNDIVQVELAGPGTVSIVLEGSSGPAAPVNYAQNVVYVKGHAGIVVTGATEHTNLSVFSVGRGNAGNTSLFKDDVTYDGIADISFIAIQSSNGKFGGLRTANASFWNTQGLTGVYAPGVEFTGPVYVHDINAQTNATPVFVIGSSTHNTWITGGDLEQANGKAVQVGGLTQLHMKDGSTSHYRVDAPVTAEYRVAKTNLGRLEQNGADVTTQIIVSGN